VIGRLDPLSPRLAAMLARLLAADLHARGEVDAEAERLLADLDIASARTSVASEVSTRGVGPWLDTREEAERRGVTERTIRRRCENDQIVGAWKGEDGSWRIPI
jgi:hypothetical protein